MGYPRPAPGRKAKSKAKALWKEVLVAAAAGRRRRATEDRLFIGGNKKRLK